jgi:hypothetical protein
MPLDFVDYTLERKKYAKTFSLHPQFWKAFNSSCALVWKHVKFEAGNQSAVPTTRGVYAFVVRGDSPSLPPHGFVMYIGEVGQGKKNRTLQVRYGDYLREQITKKRAGVHFMLKCWATCLDFCYAEVPDNNVNLKSLEKSLNDAMFPPYSSRDFTGTVRDAKKAF